MRDESELAGLNVRIFEEMYLVELLILRDGTDLDETAVHDKPNPIDGYAGLHNSYVSAKI